MLSNELPKFIFFRRQNNNHSKSATENMEIPAASENVNESLFPINLCENVENSGIAEIKSISQSFKHVTEEDKEGGQKANESDIILSENKMNDSVTVRPTVTEFKENNNPQSNNQDNGIKEEIEQDKRKEIEQEIQQKEEVVQQQIKNEEMQEASQKEEQKKQEADNFKVLRKHRTSNSFVDSKIIDSLRRTKVK